MTTSCRVHPHLPLDAAAVRVRDDLKHVVAEQREALVPLLRLRQALGGQVAEARARARKAFNRIRDRFNRKNSDGTIVCPI